MQCSPRGIILSSLLLVLAPARAQESFQYESPSLDTRTMMPGFGLDPETHKRLRTTIESGDYAAAEQLLVSYAERNPKSQPVLLALADVFFLSGKHLNSAIALNKAERLGPLDERHHLLLALSYVAMGRLNWAKPEFEKLASATPSSAIYSYWLARIAYRKMDINAALQYAAKAVQLDPSFIKAWDQLGLCHDAAGDSNRAIEAFENAIRLNGELPVKSPWPSLNLGGLLLRLQRFNEAEERLRESIQIESRLPAAHYRLGRVLEIDERSDEAIAEFQRAAMLDVTYPEPHYALARIYQARQDPRAATELRAFQSLRKADQKKGVTRPN
jgi:tetratricopeptide (TPR) repeat protein